MSYWKQLTSKPAGALPGGLVTKLGLLLGTGLILALILSTSLTTTDDEDAAAAPTIPGTATVGGPVESELATEIQTQQARQAAAAAAAARSAEQERARAAALALDAENSGESLPLIIDPETGEIEDPEETALRRSLRLESLERRLRSLRADPVAQSFRATGQSVIDRAASAVAAGPAPAAAAGADPLSGLAQVLQNPAVLAGTSTTPQPGTLDVPLPNSGDLPDYANPPRVVTPDDPPGWERVYEGSFLEAVLVNQLSGEFPGPVLAMVAVPFYSADRQRVLVPRGSRLIGTAQAVANQNQSRLAVGFHRLIFPDGRYVALRFQGLNQIGEGALLDQVNRHYLSTFLAAGAVGVLSGLSLYNADPFSVRAGIGAGLAESSGQILDRFLNRLPTITIRAGHRLRVWFTNDVLVPSP